MAACLSCTPSAAFPRGRNPILSSEIRFNTQEALLLLQQCTDFKQLKKIHTKIIRNSLSHDHVLINGLLRLSSSYGKMDYAIQLFYQIESPITFTWNLMIRGFTINDSSTQALLMYNQMIIQGIQLDKFTFPFIIKACLSACNLDKGKEIHAQAIKCGFSKDLFFQNTLMDFYLKCGDLNYGQTMFEKMAVKNVVSWTAMVTGLIFLGEIEAAREIFDKMPSRNVVSWTTMINGYARNRQPKKALELFWRMQLHNVQPNEFTLVSLIIACTELGSLKLGRWIHDFALKKGFKLESFLGTALIDMYSKCGSLEDARRVFGEMESKTLPTWNAMLTSLGMHGYAEEALNLFVEMEKGGFRPDAVTFVGVLCACVHLKNVDKGCRYFKCMVEICGISPVEEHYTCMIQLLNHIKRERRSLTVATLEKIFLRS